MYTVLDCNQMKPIPPPEIPGKTEWERFDNAMKRVLSVSKAEAMKAEDKPQPKPKKTTR